MTDTSSIQERRNHTSTEFIRCLYYGLLGYERMRFNKRVPTNLFMKLMPPPSV